MTKRALKRLAREGAFDATQFVEKKRARRMDLFTQFAMAAAHMAVKDANLDPKSVDVERAGVIVGSGLKVDGYTWNPVDPKRVKAFMAEVKRVRRR